MQRLGGDTEAVILYLWLKDEHFRLYLKGWTEMLATNLYKSVDDWFHSEATKC